MQMKSLNDLYVEELKDLYSAETQLVEALPLMAEGATDKELKAAFKDHLKVTKEQVKRLDQIFKGLGESPEGKTCKGMKGLIAEGNEALKEIKDPEVRDAALIAAAQRVEHYEIAGYGTARTFARRLGHTQAATLLDTTVKEEGQADHLLTQIAESHVNTDAMNTTQTTRKAA
jgi:ferritin-like metal-binding protein YciE